jgi:hypothetical protein
VKPPVKTAETLVATIEANGRTTLVSLSGAIDENSNLESLFARLVGDTVFNLAAVERVNSMGVHRWIPLITRLSAKHRIELVDISYALVQNANVVANMFGSGVVRSCMAPYFCSTCKTNVVTSVTREEVAASPDAPPTKHCARCKNELEFDELDSYFAFFKLRGR